MFYSVCDASALINQQSQIPQSERHIRPRRPIRAGNSQPNNAKSANQLSESFDSGKLIGHSAGCIWAYRTVIGSISSGIERRHPATA
jgi:hypothetical protein